MACLISSSEYLISHCLIFLDNLSSNKVRPCTHDISHQPILLLFHFLFQITQQSREIGQLQSYTAFDLWTLELSQVFKCFSS
jgi:hypothetical protein